MRALGYVFVCLILMTVDHRYTQLKSMRTVLSTVVVPVQYLADLPIEMADWLSSTISSRRTLQQENAKLRAQQLLLEGKVQRLLAIEKENSQLRALLQSASNTKSKAIAARLLAVHLDPFVQQVVLDKGKKHKLHLGQPVLDPEGVMGQVIDVGLVSSRVLLITDNQSAIPVQVTRNGVRAIASGNGSIGTLSLLHLPKTTDIKIGDQMITSGLGGNFPYGYPVGVVSQIDDKRDDHFLDVLVEPKANLHRSRQVILIWPEQSEDSDADQIG